VKLKILCDAAGIACPEGREEMEISSVVTDSRRSLPGSLFVCICGLHTDGHGYIPQAVERGATCIVVQAGAAWRQPEKDVVVLTSEDTRRACAFLYHAWYGFPAKRLKLIGVTGTNGKTTVTHMLRHILESALYRCGLIGTVGCESAGRRLESGSLDPLANMTTPDPGELYRLLAEMAEDGVEYVLMEVTSHALALGKVAPLTFEAAIFTNLTPEHLDFHGDMEAYAKAKSALFAQSRLAVLNGESPWADRMRASAAGRTVTCGAGATAADYTARDPLWEGQMGVSYRLTCARSSMQVTCPVPGRFTVENSMQAAACAMELGVRPTTVKDALASLTGVRGRMERISLGLGADFTVLVDYAHTPDALENLLRTVCDLRRAGQRIVLLFGCGGDRDRGKRPLMGRLASRYADLTVVTSDNSRSEDPALIIGEILAGMDPQAPRVVIPDRASAIAWAVEHAQEGDLLLLAGKGHEEYEINGEGRRPFRERELVRAAFEERLRQRKKCDNTEK
ncbi:MAG: UDP-N-acetylmuramoyl-L-alanyl-D-glutamate--2,6-diaminopimelate ligase, partial [Clostridia bacterium]|nr:UDP-N-acetylmuramoyl-L-alanyl-D-glutamate--2,6-diaminopimelate ligase [Clostridia bacterium]